MTPWETAPVWVVCECVQACPTGALMPSKEVGLTTPDKKVESVCPYCGVGCLLTYNVKDNKILYTDGRDGPANLSRLCVKGRYGFDYINNDGEINQATDQKKRSVKRYRCIKV